VIKLVYVYLIAQRASILIRTLLPFNHIHILV